MGKRGTKPKPTNLRLLHGDRKDRINTAEPVTRDGLPACPDDVSDEVRDIWNYTLEQLTPMRVATPADRDALLAYCEAVALHREASRIIAAEGIVTTGTMGGQVRHPAVQVQRDAATMIRSFAGEFGLTPSSRSTIKAAPDSGEKRDAERLLS